MPCSSHARNPPAHWPGRSIVAMTASSWPIRRTRSMRPDSSTHQSSAGRPSSKRSVARGVRHLLARGGELGHLLVREAVEDRDGTQLVGERHVAAR